MPELLSSVNPARLSRAIGPVQATALVAGIIIGASIFVQPSELTREVRSVPLVLLAWTAAGLLSLAGALICAELSSAYPGTGGVYVFLKQTISPAVAFLWGWAMFWSMHTGIIAAVAVIHARYAEQLLPLAAIGGPAGYAILIILIISGINYLGVRQGSAVQAAFTMVKVAAIALLIVFGFALAGRVPDHFVGGAGDPVGIDNFLRAVGAGLFAFGGWHMVTYTAEETSDPGRTLPRALLMGMLLVITIYIALNTLYLYILPVDQVIASTRVAADAADAVLGSGGATLLALLVVVSTFGALGGLILSGPRVYLAMADDRLIPSWFARVHPRYLIPDRAIALQAIWAAVLVATGTYRALFTRVIYTEWIFFAVLAVGLLLARRRRDYAPLWRLPAAPAVAGLFALAGLAIAINVMISDPLNSAIGLGMVAAGLPVYFLMRRPQ